MAKNNSFVAHVWASGSGKYARSSSMSTKGNVIHSYGTAIGANFELCPADEASTHPDIRPGDRVFFLNSNSYSQTTASKHMPEVRRAIPTQYHNSSRAELIQIVDGSGNSWELYDFADKHAGKVFYTGDIQYSLEAQIAFTHAEYLKATQDDWKAIASANKPNKLKKFGMWFDSWRQLQVFSYLFALPMPELPTTQEDLQDRYETYLKLYRITEEKKAHNKELKRQAKERARAEALCVEADELLHQLDTSASIDVTTLAPEVVQSISEYQELVSNYKENRAKARELEPTHVYPHYKEARGFLESFRVKRNEIQARKLQEAWLLQAPEAQAVFDNALEQWKNGVIGRRLLDAAASPQDKPWQVPALNHDIGDLLRLKPDTSDIVETDRSAEVPLSHVLKAIRFVKRLWAEGKQYTRTDHSVMIGMFRLESVTADWVTVGCHRFSKATIEDFAERLQLRTDLHKELAELCLEGSSNE